MKDIKEQLENLYLAGFNKNDARGRKIIRELSQTISDTRREVLEEVENDLIMRRMHNGVSINGMVNGIDIVYWADIKRILSKLQENKGEI